MSTPTSQDSQDHGGEYAFRAGKSREMDSLRRLRSQIYELETEKGHKMVHARRWFNDVKDDVLSGGATTRGRAKKSPPKKSGRSRVINRPAIEAAVREIIAGKDLRKLSIKSVRAEVAKKLGMDDAAAEAAKVNIKEYVMAALNDVSARVKKGDDEYSDDSEGGCSNLKKTVDPKCEETAGCEWVKGKGCQDAKSGSTSPSPKSKTRSVSRRRQARKGIRTIGKGTGQVGAAVMGAFRDMGSALKEKIMPTPLSEALINQMKVAELRAKLRELGMDSKGKKAELVKRLKTAIPAPKMEYQPMPADVKVDGTVKELKQQLGDLGLPTTGRKADLVKRLKAHAKKQPMMRGSPMRGSPMRMRGSPSYGTRPANRMRYGAAAPAAVPAPEYGSYMDAIGNASRQFFSQIPCNLRGRTCQRVIDTTRDSWHRLTYVREGAPRNVCQACFNIYGADLQKLGAVYTKEVPDSLRAMRDSQRADIASTVGRVAGATMDAAAGFDRVRTSVENEVTTKLVDGLNEMIRTQGAQLNRQIESDKKKTREIYERSMLEKSAAEERMIKIEDKMKQPTIGVTSTDEEICGRGGALVPDDVLLPSPGEGPVTDYEVAAAKINKFCKNTVGRKRGSPVGIEMKRDITGSGMWAACCVPENPDGGSVLSKDDLASVMRMTSRFMSDKQSSLETAITEFETAFTEYRSRAFFAFDEVYDPKMTRDGNGKAKRVRVVKGVGEDLSEKGRKHLQRITELYDLFRKLLDIQTALVKSCVDPKKPNDINNAIRRGCFVGDDVRTRLEENYKIMERLSDRITHVFEIGIKKDNKHWFCDSKRSDWKKLIASTAVGAGAGYLAANYFDADTAKSLVAAGVGGIGLSALQAKYNLMCKAWNILAQASSTRNTLILVGGGLFVVTAGALMYMCTQGNCDIPRDLLSLFNFTFTEKSPALMRFTLAIPISLAAAYAFVTLTPFGTRFLLNVQRSKSAIKNQALIALFSGVGGVVSSLATVSALGAGYGAMAAAVAPQLLNLGASRLTQSEMRAQNKHEQIQRVLDAGNEHLSGRWIKAMKLLLGVPAFLSVWATIIGLVTVYLQKEADKNKGIGEKLKGYVIAFLSFFTSKSATLSVKDNKGNEIQLETLQKILNFVLPAIGGLAAISTIMKFMDDFVSDTDVPSYDPTSKTASVDDIVNTLDSKTVLADVEDVAGSLTINGIFERLKKITGESTDELYDE